MIFWFFGLLAVGILWIPRRTSAAALQWDVLTTKNGHLPIAGPIQQTGCLVADVDNDGVDEIFIAGRGKAPALTLIRKTRHGYMRYVVEPEPIPLEAGGAACDIDGDGYPDIVFGEDFQGDKLYWWENPGPNLNPEVPWKRHVIKSGGKNQHHDQIFGDFDGDGKPELVFWNQQAKTLYWAKIPEDPRAGEWERVAIYEGPGEGLAKGDLDEDGVDELFAAGMWFKYHGGTTFHPHLIDATQRMPRLVVADFNKDGRLEVVMSPSDTTGRLRYYAFSGNPADPKSWTCRDLLGEELFHAHTLQAADFDGDGNLDLLVGEMRELYPGANQNPDATLWLLLGDGRGNFSVTELVKGNGVHEGKVGDFDGDGKPDIAAKPYCWDTPRLDLWLNRTLR